MEKLKILLVDQDANVAKALRKRHTLDNIETIEVVSSNDFNVISNKIKKEYFDIILLDIYSLRNGKKEEDAETEVEEQLLKFQQEKLATRKVLEKYYIMRGVEYFEDYFGDLKEKYGFPPIAIYSRHAKSLLQTNYLNRLLFKGVNIAWKPKHNVKDILLPAFSDDQLQQDREAELEDLQLIISNHNRWHGLKFPEEIIYSVIGVAVITIILAIFFTGEAENKDWSYLLLGSISSLLAAMVPQIIRFFKFIYYILKRKK